MNLESFCSKIRLVGSEPQIKWATTIRKKKIEECKKLSIRHMALALKPLIKQEELETMKCTSRIHVVQMMWAVAKYALSCPNAAWWIAHRDDKFLDWLPNAAKECVTHFKKTKPFK